MRKFALLALLPVLLVGLAGCASTASSYGSFIKKPIQTHDKAIADDAVKQLAVLYPPASTRFNLQHATPDFFGAYLLESLRSKGYAVLEFKPGLQAQAVMATDGATLASSSPSPSPSPSSSGLSLSYLLDQAQGSDLYRLTLVINRQQSLARAYQVQGDAIHPAGHWVRKE